jgi:hypothetical protein
VFCRDNVIEIHQTEVKLAAALPNNLQSGADVCAMSAVAPVSETASRTD